MLKVFKCKCCGKRPDEIVEYILCAKDEDMTPDEYVQEDGTFNKSTGKFYCTDCYVSIGMPLGTA